MDKIQEKSLKDNNLDSEQQQEFLNYARKIKDNIEKSINSNQLEEAKKILNELGNVLVNDPEIYSMKAIIEITEGNVNKAEDILKEGLKLDSYNFDLMYNLAYLYNNTELDCKPLALYYYNCCLKAANNENVREDILKLIKDIKKELGIDKSESRPLISIVVLAYNKLEYTKMCVESIYKYTSHLDFELITVNNGSSDGTKEYFDSLPNTKKVNIKNNVGGVNGFNAGLVIGEGKYLAYVGNDCVVTTNWLDNMLRCIESDEKIGLVTPGANVVSNMQQISVQYNSLEQMQEFAKQYNISDNKKWEERTRVMMNSIIMRKALFDEIGGIDHSYYLGEFADDHFSFVIRRMGYKTVFAKDTFIHHFGSVTGNYDQRVNNSLGVGKEIFIKKWGIDPWREATFDGNIISKVEDIDFKGINILGINAYCGGTPLQVKNKLKELGNNNIRIYNFTDNHKYIEDLKTVSDNVYFNDINNIYTCIPEITFNYIVIESGIERANDLAKFLKFLKDKSYEGQIFLKVDNPFYYLNIMRLFSGNFDSLNSNFKMSFVNIKKLIEELTNNGFMNMEFIKYLSIVPDNDKALLEKVENMLNINNKEDLKISEYLISASTRKNGGKNL